jgi:hypothetical protein
MDGGAPALDRDAMDVAVVTLSIAMGCPPVLDLAGAAASGSLVLIDMVR